VGLYDGVSGERLTIVDASGNRVTDEITFEPFSIAE
jgi:hypothetical protein